MKKIKLFVSLMLVCGCYLMPIRAAQSIKISFAATGYDNQGAIYMEAVENVNAFSLNLKIDGEAVLDSLEPSEEMIAVGAKVNYVYQADTQTLDIYVTSKKTFTGNEKFKLADLNFSGEEGAQVNVVLNENKDVLKTVNANASTIHNSSTELTMDAEAFFLKSTITTPDNGDNEDPDGNPVLDLTLKDDKTGITVVSKNGALLEGTTAKVIPVIEKSKLDPIAAKLKQLSTKFEVYDITLWKDAAAVQPKEGTTVEVRMPIPSGYNKENLAIYCVDSEVETFNVKIEGEEAAFETSHFSTYVIAEKNVEPTNPGDPNGTQNPNDTNTTDPDIADTPNGTNNGSVSTAVASYGGIALFVIVLGAAAFGLITYRKKNI